ncbi:MAG: hypothetical protein FWD06_10425 [Oscillospiraceae bacterium]|nr:hypothetical protein [Oscillospiraceae bacterium]
MDKPQGELAKLIEQIQHDDAPARNPRGPGLSAWVSAVLVVLFAAVMFIPAALNVSLTSYAGQGLWHELRGNNQAAIDVYTELINAEADIEAWARDNFALGTGTGFTTNHFSIARRILMLQRLYGPIDFWRMEQQMHLHQMPPLLSWFESTRMPRRLASFAAQVELVEQILLDDMQRDEVPTRYVLIYDSINLAGLAMQDPTSDEVGVLLAELQSHRRHEWWMTSTVAQERARALENWPLLANLAEQAVARNPYDFAAMQRHVRALFLMGDEEQAHVQARDYAFAQPDIYPQMQLQRADFYLRQGLDDIAEAIAESLRSNHPLQHAQDNSIHMNATALQGATLLLRGAIDQAVILLQGYVEGPFLINEQLLFTAYAARIAAGDTEFVEHLTTPLHPQLQALYAGETTLHDIFTTGWGVLA